MSRYVHSAVGGWAAIALLAIAALLAGCGPHDSIRNVVTAERVNQAAIQPNQRVALIPFTGSSGRALSDLLSIELLRRGVDMVDRDSLDRIVAEMRRTESGAFDNDLTDQQVFAQIGKIVGADFIIVGETEAWRANNTTGLAGKASPLINWSESRLTMRVFAVTDGQVVYWGTTETFITAPEGRYVKILDYLRLTAKRAADSLTRPDYNAVVLEAEGRRIPGIFPPG